MTSGSSPQSPGMSFMNGESAVSNLSTCSKGSRFDYLRQQHFIVLQGVPPSRPNQANNFSGLFFGNFRSCPHRLPIEHAQSQSAGRCLRCAEIQQKRDMAHCSSLFVELMEAVKVVEYSDPQMFGFSVGAKSSPSIHDLPWIENVYPKSPSAAKLRPRERILTVNGKSVAGLSAREVKKLVLSSRIKLHLEVFGELEDESRVRCEILCRGRLGCLQELAESWCRKVENSSCEFNAKAVQAYKEIQSALKVFVSLLEANDDPNDIVEILEQKASLCKGCHPPPNKHLLHIG